jgi:hypothetical protein
MKTKRTIELTVESSSVSVLRRTRPSMFAWCAVCDAEVRMISPEQAAARAGVSVRAIYSSVEAGQIHFLENHEGSLLVCAESLGVVARP